MTPGHSARFSGRQRFAGVLAFVLLLSATSLAHAKGGADDKYGRAQQSFDEAHYQQALELFREVADELQSPNALFMAGRCLAELGRHAEAWETMGAAVDLANERANEDERYLRTRDAAAAQREKLKAKVGLLTIAVADPPGDLTIRVGSRKLASDEVGKQIAVTPGAIVVKATASGFRPFSSKLDLDAGQIETVVVTLAAEGDEPPPADPTSLRIAGFVGLGVGVAGFVTLAVAGTTANAQYAVLEDSCATPPCPSTAHTDAVDKGKRLDTIANVGLAVGVVGAVAGATLLIVAQSRDGQDDVGLRVSPFGLSLHGRF